MKKIFLFLLCFSAFSTFAQQNDSAITLGPTPDPYEVRTLFGKNKKIGGYGAFGFGYTQMNNADAFIVSGLGGVIIGQHLTLGLAGKGFSTDFKWDNTNNTTTYSQVGGGYGGLLFEPILFPRFPIHLSFPIVLGAGGVASYYRYYDSNYEYWRYGTTEADVFFIFEPGVELEFNVAKFLRVSFGAYYRLTSSVILDRHPETMMNGLSAMMVFKFGKF